MKVGVIGLGVVGKPLYKALKFYHKNVYGYDKFKKQDSWYDIIDTNMVFLCVPTDVGEDGRLDMKVVDDVLNKLCKDKYKGVVVIKSTLRLGYVSSATKKYTKDFKIVVFPEWLYAKKAFPDTLNPEMTVIGVTRDDLADDVLKVCCWHEKEKAFIVQPEEATMIKLTANALGATKISFANQIGIICDSYGLNAHRIMDVIKKDPRCAPRYLTPGSPFGGYCLPKDTSELSKTTFSGLETDVTELSESHPEAFLLDAVQKVNTVMKKRLDEQE